MYLRTQQGITKFIMPLVILGLIAWLGFKIIPVYLEQSKILSSLESLKSVPEVAKHNPATVKSALLRRFGVNDVQRINSANYDENITYTRASNGFDLVVIFNDEIPLFGNLYLVSKFEQVIEFR